MSSFEQAGMQQFSSGILKTLFHALVPASCYGGRTAFSVLSKLTQELGACEDVKAAAAVLERSKPDLYKRLRARFSHPAAQALTLKVLNLLFSDFHLSARATFVRSSPIGLVIDPSNMCRLACPGCVHSERSEALRVFDWPNGTLSSDCFAALLRCYGPSAIGAYFCNYGEPLLNLQTPQLIRTAKRYLMGTALSTSLSVSRFDADAYVKSGLDFMVLSIDGATQAVYERYRRNGKLHLVFDNVRRLVEAKRRLGSRTPVLSWNFLAFEHNAHEIPAALRMARRLGVNQFRIVNPFDVGWDDPDVRPAKVTSGVRRLDWRSAANLPENWNPFPDAVDADAITEEFERPLDGQAGDNPLASPGHSCHWLYKNMVMDATGRIMPCCGAPRPDADLVFATFDPAGGDPFNSEKYRRARAHFAGAVAAGSSSYCAQCEWDQTMVNIGGPEIRRYFRAADAAFFDRRCLRILSGV